MLAITVNLCLIETGLKRGYFLKTTRESINVSVIAVIHIFLNENLSEAVAWSYSARKVVLKISQHLQQKLFPVTCNFNEKETLLPALEFCETFKDTFFKRTPPVVVSGPFF